MRIGRLKQNTASEIGKAGDELQLEKPLDVSQAARDKALKQKLAQLNEEAEAAEAAVLAGVQAQLSQEVAAYITVTGALHAQSNGLYSRRAPHKGVPRFENTKGLSCPFMTPI